MNVQRGPDSGVDLTAGLQHQSAEDVMGTIDRRHQLDDEPFSYRVVKNGNVFIAWQGKAVTTLNGKAAGRFLAQIDGLDGQAAQLVMAKVTGNFKRGNERTSQERSRR